MFNVQWCIDFEWHWILYSRLMSQSLVGAKPNLLENRFWKIEPKESAISTLDGDPPNQPTNTPSVIDTHTSDFDSGNISVCSDDILILFEWLEIASICTIEPIQTLTDTFQGLSHQLNGIRYCQAEFSLHKNRMTMENHPERLWDFWRSRQRMINHPDQMDAGVKDGRKVDSQETFRSEFFEWTEGNLLDLCFISANFTNEIRFSWMR